MGDAMRPLVLAAALFTAGSALARDVAGLEVPETSVCAGRTLRLNGAGLRRKLLFRVYVGALYLESASSDPAAILAADAPWKITLHFLRDVDHEPILEAFREAFDHNSPPGELPGLHAGLARFHEEVMSTLTVRAGQELTLVYQPGQGSTLTVPGGASSRVEGKRFADALLLTWLGDHPADRALKEALLGR
jgi:hypothetical protein